MAKDRWERFMLAIALSAIVLGAAFVAGRAPDRAPVLQTSRK